VTDAAAAPLDLLRQPDAVHAFDAEGRITLEPSPDGLWTGGGRSALLGGRRGIALGCDVLAGPDGRVRLVLNADVPVARLQLRWRGDLTGIVRYLGDAWERSYADLEWRGEAPERVMPWYLLTDDGRTANGYGVAVQPNALCAWMADSDGLSLWIDVRNGGSPIVLGDRRLAVCDVVQVHGADGERAFAVQQRLCRAMCPSPRMPDHPVYGTNDWHFAMGDTSFDVIARSSEFISAASPDLGNRPYSVIDDGWSRGGLGHGPWLGNQRFGEMDAVARRLVDLGVRPGIWYRPLTPLPEHGDRWRLSRGGGALDPTVPEVSAGVAEHLRRIVGWGYTMVKHDFTTWDLLGRWGFGMGIGVTDDGWSFADRSKTTAEVVLDLYRLIREACGDALVIGCNTFSHLSAGLFELQRTGDDTSGRSWNRTRRMGINTLAFRAAQHGTLYAVDADIAPITAALPWQYAVQWLHLLSASGTAAFASVDPASRTPNVAAALKDAFTLAAQPLPVAEPLDWTTSLTPSRWRFGDREQTYHWMEPDGGWPFGD